MRKDGPSRSRDGQESGRRDAGPLAAMGGILLLALGLRVFYAHGLPLNPDEVDHLQMAREISLLPGSFNLPLASPATNHPPGAVYLTALAHWVGGGNVFVIRLAFITLSLFGLVGLYVLGASMFGTRPALLALGLAAVDRHLVAVAPVFLEPHSMISLVPWTILLMHRCLTRGSRPDWLAAGLLFGLGYWLSALFLAMLLPFGLCILLTGRLGRVLKSPWMYAGLAVTAAVILPHLIADQSSGWVNYQRNVSKVGTIGLSPRMALLYVGDLLICAKDTTWIVQNIGGKMYLPVYVPCHWLMGFVYLALVVTSLRFWRDERIVLLLVVILGFLIPVTVIDARESWNEFTWASPTVFAAILLAAFMIDRMLPGKWGKLIASTVLICAVGSLLSFLTGPKWGYFCPEWERSYVGRVMAAESRSRWNPLRFPPAQTAEEISEWTDEVLARHPESFVAWFFRAHYAKTTAERADAVRRALELDPNNPLVLLDLAEDRTRAGDWAGARELLSRLLARGCESYSVYEKLAEVEYRLGNYRSTVTHALQAVALQPEDVAPYLYLVAGYDAMGQKAKAEESLNVYVARFPFGRAGAYLSLAVAFWEWGEQEKGRAFLERGIQTKPHRAKDHYAIGMLLSKHLNDLDGAATHLEAAVRMGFTTPEAYYNLARCREAKRDFIGAEQGYRKAIQLDPAHGGAHLRLGALLVGQNRIDEAREHLQAAEQLGFVVPSAYDNLLRGKPPAQSARP